MACARSETCSLVKMFEMWLVTVFGLKNRRRVISALLRPCAMSSRTSRSRAVSSGKASRGAAGLTARHGADDPEDLVPVGAFEDVAAGSGAHRGEDPVVVFVHGEDDHAH